MNYWEIKLGFLNYLKAQKADVTNYSNEENNVNFNIFEKSDDFNNYMTNVLKIDYGNKNYSVADFMNLEIVDGKIVDKNGSSKNSELISLLNNVLTEQSVIKNLDTDNSGALDKSEIEKFINKINSIDETDSEFDKNNLSLKEVFDGVIKISKNEYTYNEPPVVEEAKTTQASEEGTAPKEKIIPEVTVEAEPKAEAKVEPKVEVKAEPKAESKAVSTSETTTPTTTNTTAQTTQVTQAPVQTSQPETQVTQTDATTASYDTGTSYDTSGNYSSYDTSYDSGYNTDSYDTENYTDDINSGELPPETKSIQEMSKEELTAELETNNTTLSTQQGELTKIQNGTDENIKALKNTADNAYKTYQDELKKVDEESAKVLGELKTAVDTAQTDFDNKCIELTQAENDEEVAKQSYADATKAASEAEKSRATLQEQLKEALEANNGFLAGEIMCKMTELQTIVANKSIKEEEYQKAIEKTGQLKKEKADLEIILEEKKKALADKENELNEKYPELKELLTAAQEAQKAYEQGKASAISSKQNEITQTKQNIKDINVEIAKRDAEEKAKAEEKNKEDNNIIENPFIPATNITTQDKDETKSKTDICPQDNTYVTPKNFDWKIQSFTFDNKAVDSKITVPQDTTNSASYNFIDPTKYNVA